MIASTSAALALLALRLLAPAPAPTQPCTDMVEGRVVDQTTRQPVSGALVRLGQASVETDETGHFELRAVCPGDNSLTVERLDSQTVRR